MNAAQFIAKWQRVELTEKSASQQHFLDLCELLDHPKPAEADPTGESFTFERGAKKHGGGDGWADVWKKGFFGWEYKGKHKDLDAAYDQLLQYREALANPPLLVVCDMDRIVVHTNFTSTQTIVHPIALAELDRPRHLEILRAVFHDPARLKPGATSEAITAEAATHIAEIAQDLRSRGLDPQDVARFLDRIIFCLFAEDIELLPERLFTRLVEKGRDDPARFTKVVRQLFDAMATGGDFGVDVIPHFNGNLFEAGPVLELTADEIERVWQATGLDWSAVDPSIFGTLFERGMDPARRSQLGLHYTSRTDIETLVEPVVMQPLRREWAELRQTIDNLLATGKKKPTGREKKPPSKAVMRKARKEAPLLIQRFLQHLAFVKVLDPACGSGNFLYVTLQKLKDLEKEVIQYSMRRELGGFFPMANPTQLYGIEISPYAHELAQMTVWIGYIQWLRNNGFGRPSEPILKPMHNFQCKDAILDITDPDLPKESDWPKVDFIVGNPPFLGGNRIRRELGDEYVTELFALYEGRLSAFADLCCYWFERARGEIRKGNCKRAGLLATQGIRGGVNREVLKRIKERGDIFFAQSDRDWILDGASVHVSMVGFDDGTDHGRQLDGRLVTAINANLSSLADITCARRLTRNLGLWCYGSQQKAKFDLGFPVGLDMLVAPNASGRPNSDVVKQSLNGAQVLRRTHDSFVIDFGLEKAMDVPAQYEAPFEYVREHILPVREHRRETVQRRFWWLHARPSPRYREYLQTGERYIVTPGVSKHRIFVWMDPVRLVDHATIVFLRSDAYFLGVLHSSVHELWSRAHATQVRERESGLRYTPKACFETFAFPEPTAEQESAIGAAAKELDELRNNWLNPPEWVTTEVLQFPGSVDGPWKRYVHDPDDRGIGTVRYPRLVANSPESATKLKKRTLTNLYNQRPTWLDLAHRQLDAAVFDAYGWDPGMSDEEILEKLLELNLARSKREDETADERG